MPQHRKVWNSNPILEVYHVSLETKSHLAIFDPYATGCWGLRTKNHTQLSTLFHSDNIRPRIYMCESLFTEEINFIVYGD